MKLLDHGIMRKFLLISGIFLTRSSDFIIFYFLLLFLYAWLWKREKCTVSESNVWKGLNRFFLSQKKKKERDGQEEFFKLEDELYEQKKPSPLLMRFIKWRVRCTKANPGKQGSEKESMGPSILIQKPGLKKERGRESENFGQRARRDIKGDELFSTPRW